MSRLFAWLNVLLFVSAIFSGRAAASPVYNGGPLITGTPDVHFIWYGDWGTDTATSILPGFINNLSGTSYMNIATSYSTGSYTIGNQVNFGGNFFISSTQNSSIYTAEGTTLNGTPGVTGTGTIADIVSSTLAAMPSWATDPNGIFDVLTTSSISVSGMYSTFCGWHYSTNWGGASLGTQYGFIGDPTQDSGCNVSLQDPPTANANFGADAMASVIAHELFETISDPTGLGWWDSNPSSSTNNNETADMCAWQFGSTFTTGNGGNANVTLNGANYLLQQEWVNQGGGLGYQGGACTLSSVPEPAGFAVLLPSILGLATVRWRRIAA